MNNNPNPYEIKLFSLPEYLSYQFARWGLRHMLSITNKGTGYGYPRILARAYCDHVRREIVAWRRIDGKCLMHEIGHEIGRTHRTAKQNVMYPFYDRGTGEMDIIYHQYRNMYGPKAGDKLFNIFSELK